MSTTIAEEQFGEHPAMPDRWRSMRWLHALADLDGDPGYHWHRCWICNGSLSCRLKRCWRQSGNAKGYCKTCLKKRGHWHECNNCKTDHHCSKTCEVLRTKRGISWGMRRLCWDCTEQRIEARMERNE